MRYWTWGEIRTKIEQECDLEDETFIRLYEDYFLKKVEIPIIANDELFAIPTYMSDIYADKIRRIIFKSSGDTTYTITRLKDWKKFEQKALADTQTTTDLYQYFLINSTPGSPQIMLVPKARESGTMVVWYLRNANRLSIDADICDIPEFINFIFAHLKVKIYSKEGHPGYQEALERLETERNRMNSVLSSRVPDAENEIELDMSSYNEMN